MDDLINRATIYTGEAVLLRWSDGPKGKTITLLLNPDGLDHPFRSEKTGAEHGQRMQAVFVRINDTEEPQPAQAEASAAQTNVVPVHKGRPFKSLPRSQQAGIRLGDEAFQRWLFENYADKYESSNHDQLLKAVLSIISKRDLDSAPHKAAAWDALETDYQLRGYQQR